MNRAKTRLSLIICFLITTVNIFGQSTKQSDFKRIVFIAGPDSHGKGEHEHNGGSKLLAQKIKVSFPQVQTVVCENGWPKDSSVFNQADAVIIFCDGGGDHMLMPYLERLDKILTKDVGVGMIHFTLEIPKELGQKYFLKWIGGYFETDWSVNPVWTASFKSFPDHPVANGVKPFIIKDEWYYHMRFSKDMEGITPILKTLPPDLTLNREEGTHSNNKYVRQAVLVDKKPQILAWTFERTDGGRGFGFTGGHIHANWKDDNFRKLVLNAVAWTAKISIPENGVNSETTENEELERLSKQL